MSITVSVRPCTSPSPRPPPPSFGAFCRDPDDPGADTAAAIRRMKEARTRAVKGGGVKEVKTLKALQQELKVTDSRSACSVTHPHRLTEAGFMSWTRVGRVKSELERRRGWCVLLVYPNSDYCCAWHRSVTRGLHA